MDYQDSFFPKFIDAVSEIMEPPRDTNAEGEGVTHNPVYHLKRYVDGISAVDLVLSGVAAGLWDAKEFSVFTGLDFKGFVSILYDAVMLAGWRSNCQMSCSVGVF
jgi:hypothetical protein